MYLVISSRLGEIKSRRTVDQAWPRFEEYQRLLWNVSTSHLYSMLEVVLANSYNLGSILGNQVREPHKILLVTINNNRIDVHNQQIDRAFKNDSLVIRHPVPSLLNVENRSLFLRFRFRTILDSLTNSFRDNCYCLSKSNFWNIEFT